MEALRQITKRIGLSKQAMEGFFIRIFLFSLIIFPSFMLSAQNSSFAIKATAVVVEISGINIITISDIQIDINSAQDGIIKIPALSDPHAGVMKVEGRPNAFARISFLPESLLQNSQGVGVLKFNYEVNGYYQDNQVASEPIHALERMIQFNEQGIYYLWIGGRIDVSEARPGNYAGEFTIEIEYL